MKYPTGLLLTVASAAFLIVCTPVAAQWQTPDHSVPVGRGSGTGFKFASPGAAGQFLISNGASSDPSFQALPSIITSDVFFKSGKPWADVRAWGATGNGVTNDTTAVQNAINSMSGGGSVYFPPGTYCVNGGVSVTSGAVRLIGPGTEQSVVVSTCGANVTAITLNSFAAGMQGLFVLGGGLTATQPAVTIGTSCVECYVAHNKIEFGSIPLNILGSDNLFFDNVVGYGYGAAAVYTRGSNFFDKLKADQPYPVSTPSIGAAPAARANTTGYTTGQIVSLSGYYIQATNNGTSGGSPPSLQNYGTNIVDGTVTWQLVAPATYYSMQVDTGVTFMSLRNSDHTGPFTYGLYFSNSLAGTNPQTILISDITVGGTFSAGIFLANGSGFSIKGAQIANCVVTNCSGITAGAGFGGDITISGGIMFGVPFGINITAGNNWSVVNNQIYGASGAAIAVQTNRNRISITNNNLGNSSLWGTNAIGIFLAAGTSDYLAINDNITDGATTPYSNAGTTGTHNAICIANVCNTGPAPTRAGDVVYYNGTTWTSLAGNNSGTNCLSENASGVPSWAACSGGGGGSPGGSTTQVQYNNAGAFAGITGATTNGTALTLVAPILGTPASATLTNATGLPISTGVSGLGTGIATALGVNVGTAGSPVVNGGVLGTPSSGTLTNATGLPIATGVSGLGTGCATFLGTPSSANLRGCLTDEVGTGAAYFVGGALGTPASGTATNLTGLPISTGLTGAGTGVLTALGVNVGSAGAPVINGGVLGTPSSGTLTNATGLPISTGVSGLGTGIATALGVNVGTAGAPVLFNGAGGTPSSMTGTNVTGIPNAGLVNSATTVAGVTCTLGSTCGLSKVTNSLSGDVALNNATYSDGPSVAQGTSGTWFASGTVTFTDTGAAPNVKCKLWDGTTVFASAQSGGFGAANAIETIALSGYLASPAANIRISCIDNTTATGVLKFNSSGNSMDSTLSAFRIN